MGNYKKILQLSHLSTNRASPGKVFSYVEKENEEEVIVEVKLILKKNSFYTKRFFKEADEKQLLLLTSYMREVERERRAERKDRARKNGEL